jgi:hypothetical protein
MMIVIVHQTVGLAEPVEHLYDGPKHKEKILSILIAQQYFIPLDSGDNSIFKPDNHMKAPQTPPRGLMIRVAGRNKGGLVHPKR